LAHYKKDAEEFDYFEERTGATEHSERRLREYILSMIPSSANSILDIGSGSAWLAKAFVGKNVFVCSTDATIVNTSKALENYPSEFHAAVVADAFMLPFADNSFDCVVAAEIIEHVVDPKKFVQELMRVLSPRGVLIVSTPYKEVIRYALCVHCNQKTPLNSHLHSFDESKLRDLYDRATLDSFAWKAFNNKLLLFARTFIVLQYFPFALWKFTDSVASAVFNKRVNIITTATKKSA
jgi:ubiquinone/menaquinone biosynthesis C-methylase UbiE